MALKRLNTSANKEKYLEELQLLSQSDLLTRINFLLEMAQPYYVHRFDKTKNARSQFVSEIVSPISYCILVYCHRELYANIPQLKQDGDITDSSLPIVPNLYSILMVVLKPVIADTFICEKIYRSLSGLSPWLKENKSLYFICLQASAIMRTKKFNITRKVIVPEGYRSFDDQLDQL